MSKESASFLGVFRANLADWFEHAFPAELGQPPEKASAEKDDEARRRSIHEVAPEQMGLTHWSCHSQF